MSSETTTLVYVTYIAASAEKVFAAITRPEISVLILAVCLLTVLPRKMRFLFLGSERICSTTTEGKDESEAACSASNKLGVGASEFVKRPEASHNRTSRAKIEAIFRLFFIIPVTPRP